MTAQSCLHSEYAILFILCRSGHFVEITLKLIQLSSLFLFDSGSGAASCSTAPADGAVDLQEEEMEQSVFGQESYLMLLMPKQN